MARRKPRSLRESLPGFRRLGHHVRPHLKPERSTLRVLERRVEDFLPEELELYFDDIVDAAERIWDLLDN